jgi:hypothetical protein
MIVSLHDRSHRFASRLTDCIASRSIAHRFCFTIDPIVFATSIAHRFYVDRLSLHGRSRIVSLHDALYRFAIDRIAYRFLTGVSLHDRSHIVSLHD